jgi:hypothetical protein
VGVACTAASQLVYVLSNQGDIYSFDPPTKVFTKVSTLDCPVGAMSPNSMAVDRQGQAWVNYFSSDDDGDLVDGSIFQVDIATGRCQATPIALPGGWYQLGMGFSSASVTDPTDTLYVAANHDTGACSGVSGSSLGLGVIDPNTGTLSAIGRFSGGLAGQNADLTGTGDGRLFGFFDLSVAEIAPIDRATAATSAPISLPGVQCPWAFAFSFWGGDFYLYTSSPDSDSSVAHFTSADGTLDTNYVADAGFDDCRSRRVDVRTDDPATPLTSRVRERIPGGKAGRLAGVSFARMGSRVSKHGLKGGGAEERFDERSKLIKGSGTMHLTLGVRVLMKELEALAKSKGFGMARVQAKVNVRGELVLAVIIPARTPGEWGEPSDLDAREAKRCARERRS